MIAPLLALLSSVCWGTGDFLGGALSRRLPTVTVVLWSQLSALVTIAAVTAVAGWHPPGRYLAWGALAGVATTTGLALFYRALAISRMSIVAPITGCSLGVPVLFGLLAGERPSGVQLAGIALAALGVVLASGPELRGADTSRRAVLYAVVAALGFGSTLVCTARGSETSSAMTLLAAFATGLLLVGVWALAARPRVLRLGPLDTVAVSAIGWMNLGATGFYAIASRSALVSVVAVLASLYPVVTVLLAWRVYAERLRGVQLAGVVSALGGVVLLGAG